MSKIRITKEFTFEAASALHGYDGACRNIHGHSYHFEVTVIGEPEPDPNHPKWGMVIDFSVLKKIVKEVVVDPLDHAFVLNKNTPHGQYKDSLGLFGNKVVFLDYQPSCENMLTDFAARISAKLPAGVKLYRLKLRETATSYAEWYAADNE